VEQDLAGAHSKRTHDLDDHTHGSGDDDDNEDHEDDNEDDNEDDDDDDDDDDAKTKVVGGEKG
jgi:hypothetical protein